MPGDRRGGPGDAAVGGDTDLSLWGLRNVRSVAGSINVRAGLERIYVDCAFRHVESLGERHFTGGSIDSSGGVARWIISMTSTWSLRRGGQ